MAEFSAVCLLKPQVASGSKFSPAWAVEYAVLSGIVDAAIARAVGDGVFPGDGGLPRSGKKRFIKSPLQEHLHTNNWH